MKMGARFATLLRHSYMCRCTISKELVADWQRHASAQVVPSLCTPVALVSFVGVLSHLGRIPFPLTADSVFSDIRPGHLFPPIPYCTRLSFCVCVCVHLFVCLSVCLYLWLAMFDPTSGLSCDPIVPDPRPPRAKVPFRTTHGRNAFMPLHDSH
jgi:hypothetical protein